MTNKVRRRLLRVPCALLGLAMCVVTIAAILTEAAASLAQDAASTVQYRVNRWNTDLWTWYAKRAWPV